MKKTLKIKIDGIYYPLKIEQSEEKKIQEIARFLDAEIEELKKVIKVTTPSHVYMMTLINITRELFDLKEILKKYEEEDKIQDELTEKIKELFD